ncbi:shikimate kinase [Piscinibacter sakaiensis]|uniref:shikimate kinase n=1 Tax=Piscinibacter sakaiensis TaxID=1547922 RepID=UPI003AAD8AA2
MPLIALVGMPGGGKSTVGRQLARRLRWDFADTDDLIERRIGTSIRQFFEQQGEDAFRDVEQSVIADAVAQRSGVLATGGGAVLRAANRDALRDGCTVVYLRSAPEELFRRLRHDMNRPLLQVANPLGRLRDLHAQRGPLYERTAHFIIETGRPSIHTLVNMILMQLELAGLIGADAAPSSIGHARQGDGRADVGRQRR